MVDGIIKSIETVMIPGLYEVTGVAALVDDGKQQRVVIFGSLKKGCNPDMDSLIGKGLAEAAGCLYDYLHSMEHGQLLEMYRKMSEQHGLGLVRHLGLNADHFENQQTGERFLPEYVPIEYANI